ncbi:MAG: M15 family metallopeptidase [Candidatus Anstonellales archaeon]
MRLESEVSPLLSDRSYRFEIRAPDANKDFIILENTLHIIRESLNKVYPHVPDYKISPPDFFLVRSLSEEQRRVVDAKLASFYAQRSVAQQEIIATVPIKESFEKMIFLPSVFQEAGIPLSLSDLPFDKACGEWAGKPRVFWVRESVAMRLVVLGEALSKAGLYFHIEDAFRPIGVQEGLFKRRVNWILNEHSDWDWEAVLTEAKSKTAVSPRLASHKSGAAIDITLRRISDGSPLDLGNKYPEGGALVAIDCPFVTAEQWRTRQIFANSFRMAGFAIYSGEDWHASYSDNLAGVSDDRVIEGYNAAYGPIKEFSLESGEILAVYHEDEYDKVFLERQEGI